MKAIKLQANIPADRSFSLQLPKDVAEGPAEVVVLISESGASAQDIFAELPGLAQRIWSQGEIGRYLREDKLLRQLVSDLRSRLGDHLKQIVLFGSRARGDHRPDSDYDCLAIVDTVTPRVEQAIDQIAGDLLYEYSAVFSVFPVSEEAYRNETHEPLFRNVEKEGIVLWPETEQPTV